MIELGCVAGAVDVSVVQNVSDIVWNEVVPFSPVGTRWNTSGYLYWAIQITGFSVRLVSRLSDAGRLWKSMR